MSWLIVFATCSLVVFAVTKADDFYDKKYEEMVKQVCGKHRTFNEDMYACWQTEPQIVIDATNDCINKAISSFEGTLVDFIEVVCRDKDTYLKVYECYSVFKSNEELWKQIEVSPKTIACYKTIVKKHGLPEPKEPAERS